MMRVPPIRPAQNPAAKRTAAARRRLLTPRGLATSAVAAVALAGTVTGVAVAGGSAGHRAGGQAAPARTGTARRSGGATATSARGTGKVRAGSDATVAHAVRQPLRTSCRSVAHIGDSTSLDLINPLDLPNPAQRLQARYADVGVKHLLVDASGGRSIVETLPSQVNGYNVASNWRAHGYRGCWVFALGTNDTANVAVGSSVGLMARINEMMSVAHGEPVMWVNTRTLLTSGPWANANEQGWDKTLVRALAKYPNMRIFDWSAVAQPSWFLPDGIHYNPAGCAMRAKAIADALARAFPLNGHSKGQIVR
jgi:hypothetical protein